MSSASFFNGTSVAFLVVQLGDLIDQWYRQCRCGKPVDTLEEEIRCIVAVLRDRVGDRVVFCGEYRSVCRSVALGADPVEGALSVLGYVSVFMSGVLEK